MEAASSLTVELQLKEVDLLPGQELIQVVGYRSGLPRRLRDLLASRVLLLGRIPHHRRGLGPEFRQGSRNGIGPHHIREFRQASNRAVIPARYSGPFRRPGLRSARARISADMIGEPTGRRPSRKVDPRKSPPDPGRRRLPAAAGPCGSIELAGQQGSVAGRSSPVLLIPHRPPGRTPGNGPRHQRRRSLRRDPGMGRRASVGGSKTEPPSPGQRWDAPSDPQPEGPKGGALSGFLPPPAWLGVCPSHGSVGPPEEGCPPGEAGTEGG